MKTQIQEMIKEAHSIEWDAIYSSKGHFNAAMLWNIIHYSLGLAAISSAVAGQQLCTSRNTSATFLAFLSAALAAAITFLKPVDKADPHHKAGTEFAALRREARIFQNIDAFTENDTVNTLARLKLLADKVKELNQNAPPIPFLAYQITKIGVRKGEATYNESDGEKS